MSSYLHNYLINHYKGKYRLKAPYDTVLNDFPRDLKGNYSTEDIYIDCYNGIKIFYYGNRILELYCPSKQRGRNIISELQKQFGNEIIFNVNENDREVVFKFKNSDMDKIEKVVKIKTSGASISPFSQKNLPKSDYKISDDKLNRYKNIIDNKPEIDKLSLGHMMKRYIESLATKNNPYDQVIKDMKRKCMSYKQYIDYIGKWDEFLEILQNEL